MKKYDKTQLEERNQSQISSVAEKECREEGTRNSSTINVTRNVKARLTYVWLFGSAILLPTCFMVSALLCNYFKRSPCKFIGVIMGISILYGLYVWINRYLMGRVVGFRPRTVKMVSTLVWVALLTEIVMTLLIALDMSDFIYWVIPWEFGLPFSALTICCLGAIGILKLFRKISKLIQHSSNKFKEKENQSSNLLLGETNSIKTEANELNETTEVADSKDYWEEIWVWIYLYAIFIYINAVYVRLTVFGADTSGIFSLMLTFIVCSYLLFNILVLKHRFPEIPVKLFNTITFLMIITYYLSVNIYAFTR